jgi:hypothetical protein
MPFVLQFDYTELPQFLLSTPIHLSISTEVSNGNACNRTEAATDRDVDVPKVSRLANRAHSNHHSSNCTTFTKTEIVALVATCLQRYLQAMV